MSDVVMSLGSAPRAPDPSLLTRQARAVQLLASDPSGLGEPALSPMSAASGEPWAASGEGSAPSGETSAPGTASAVGRLLNSYADVSGERLTDAAELAALMLNFQQLVQQMSMTQMSAASTMFSEILNVQREEALRQAKSVADQLERAAKAQKAFGWLGKILMWVATIVSLVSAAFTGGASLAIAGALAAVSITDQIVQAATGTSFVTSALDAVLTPIVTAFADLIQKTLESLGVPAKVAEIVGQILGVVLAIAAVVVVALVGRAACKALCDRIGPLISRLAQRLAQGAARMVPSSLRAGASRASAALERFSEKLLERLYGNQDAFALAASRWRRAAIATQTAVATTAVTGGVVVGSMNRNASIADAAYSQLNTSARMIEDVLRQTVETYSDSLSRGMLTVESSVDALARERQVCVQVARGIYRAA